MNTGTQKQEPILVLGNTGKTGPPSRGAAHGSRHPDARGRALGGPPFDWDDRGTWAPALQGVGRLREHYLTPFRAARRSSGLRGARRREWHSAARAPLRPRRARSRARRAGRAGLGRRVDDLASTWFSQNFSESYFIDGLLAGELALPAGSTPEPFVDADDIADVAVAALTEDGHVGEIYELTGPRLLTFGDAVGENRAGDGQGDPLQAGLYGSEDFAAALGEQGVPGDGSSCSSTSSRRFSTDATPTWRTAPASLAASRRTSPTTRGRRRNRRLERVGDGRVRAGDPGENNRTEKPRRGGASPGTGKALGSASRTTS